MFISRCLRAIAEGLKRNGVHGNRTNNASRRPLQKQGCRKPLPLRFADIVTAPLGKEALLKALALKFLTVFLLAYFAVVFLQQATRIIDSYDASYFAVVARNFAFHCRYGAWDNGAFVTCPNEATTGPAMLLPVAAVYWCFGDWPFLPGVVGAILCLSVLVFDWIIAVPGDSRQSAWHFYSLLIAVIVMFSITAKGLDHRFFHASQGDALAGLLLLAMTVTLGRAYQCERADFWGALSGISAAMAPEYQVYNYPADDGLDGVRSHLHGISVDSAPRGCHGANGVRRDSGLLRLVQSVADRIAACISIEPPTVLRLFLQAGIWIKRFQAAAGASIRRSRESVLSGIRLVRPGSSASAVRRPGLPVPIDSQKGVGRRLDGHRLYVPDRSAFGVVVFFLRLDLDQAYRPNPGDAALRLPFSHNRRVAPNAIAVRQGSDCRRVANFAGGGLHVVAAGCMEPAAAVARATMPAASRSWSLPKMSKRCAANSPMPGFGVPAGGGIGTCS